MVDKEENMEKKTEEETQSSTEENQQTDFEETEDNSQEFTKTKTQAEKLINDIIVGIQDKSEEFGKAISDYKRALQKPLTDVMETETGLTIKIDLPGVNKEDIELEIAEDSIEIKALFEEEISDENIKYLQKERSHGKTARSLTLPFNINVEEVKASFNDSILVIELPKMEKEVHKVDIN